MFKYILKRILISLVVLLGISLILFIFINLQPGNPYYNMMNPNTSAELVKERLRAIGYYDPLPKKYLLWLYRASHLDLGYSIKYAAPVFDVIRGRLGNTLLLMSISLTFSISIGCVLGIFSACKKNSIYDEFITLISFIGISIPSFFLGLLLIKKFSFDMNLLPSSGMNNTRYEYEGIEFIIDSIKHLILPVVVLCTVQITSIIRYTRSSIIDIVEKDYIKAAVAKGMSYKRAILKYGLKNALIPIITVICLQIPTLFSGALMTETVFVWPGIGRLCYDAIMNRDYPLIMGILFISSILILISNLVADIIYVLIDKRVGEVYYE